jgi:DUF917 family protein
MSTILKRSDVEELLYGATFLGAGGGGPLDTAIKMLNTSDEQHTVAVELLDLEEAEDNDYGAMGACLGSPESMRAGTFGPDAVYSFEAFQNALKLENKEVKYLYSGEMGGFNTFVPILVAVLSSKDISQRIKLLDVDANGRAVPELNTSLSAARGYKPYPVGLGSLNGNKIIAYGIDDKESEKIARTLCQLYDSQIGFATWAMSKAELKSNAIVRGVSKAQKVGQAIALAKKERKDPLEMLQPIMKCKRLTTAYIIDKQTNAVDGFDVGVTTLEDRASHERFTISFQNENLLVQRADGSVVITAPELISLLCRDNNENAYLPLNNASTEKGMLIDVILSPADELWWANDHKANEVWIPCLKRAGYTGPQIRCKW